MKKRISVRGLKMLLDHYKPRKVTLYTENQEWYRQSDTCILRLTFPNLIVYDNQNMVCLKSNTGSICFEQVRYVEVDTDSTVLGTIITVICGDSELCNETTYTLVAA